MRKAKNVMQATLHQKEQELKTESV